MGEYFYPTEKSKVIGVAMSHVGDLMNSRYGRFYWISDGANAEFVRRQSIWGGESIYLGMRIAKTASKITQGGDICDGKNRFTGLKSDSNNYAGKINDITILPEWAQKRADLWHRMGNSH